MPLTDMVKRIFDLVWFFKFQSTAMVMSERSIHLTPLFSCANLTKNLTSTSRTYFRLLVSCFTSQSTAMVMLGWSVHLTTFFPGQA